MSVPPVNHNTGTLPRLHEVVPTANESYTTPLSVVGGLLDTSGKSPTMMSGPVVCDTGWAKPTPAKRPAATTTAQHSRIPRIRISPVDPNSTARHAANAVQAIAVMPASAGADALRFLADFSTNRAY